MDWNELWNRETFEIFVGLHSQSLNTVITLRV